MKRFFTMTCLAATFAVGLAAQSTSTATTTQDPPAGGQRGGGSRTVTGCLRTGDTAGSYMLTDVVMQGGGGRRGGDATSTRPVDRRARPRTTTGHDGRPGGRGGAPTSLMLTAASDVDLKAHVGHKIEVTGTMAGGRGGAAATAAGSTTTGTTATGTTTGTTTAGTGTSTAATGTTGQGGGRGGPRSLTVTTIKMISESCS